MTRPSEPLDPSKTYTLTFDTNCGSFTVTLDQKLAPNTAASLVALANDGFFDDTIFHRIVPGFVIQGGDPTQTGARRAGLLDRRRAAGRRDVHEGRRRDGEDAGEAPGTSGSQFFVVTGDARGLPPDYAIVGKVTDGMDTVERIDALGVGRRPADAAGRHRASPSRKADGRRRGRPRGRRGVAVRQPEAADPASARARAAARDVGRRDRRRRGRVRARGSRRRAARRLRRLGARAGASLRCGLSRLGPEVEAAVVVLADGPDLAPQAVERVLEEWRRAGGVVAASYGGERGHPLVIGRADWSDIPDEGLRDYPVRLVPCDDLGAPGDVDTEEDLRRL